MTLPVAIFPVSVLSNSAFWRRMLVVFLLLCWAGSSIAQQSPQAMHTETLFLSGHGKDDGVKWNFMCSDGQHSGTWTKINVPSCWELQGFGQYDYGFAPDSIRGKEKGFYKRKFLVPAEWKSKQVNLVFEGVMTDAEVRVNGKPAGQIHQGAYYSFSYDVSTLVAYGKSNLLEVTVSKHSADGSVNEAERKGDFWLFGGIFRPVMLEALPVNHIESASMDAKADGSLKVKVSYKGKADQLMLRLTDATGKPVGATATQSLNVAASPITFQTRFDQIKLWSAEFPERYTAHLSLYSQGKLLHQIEKKIGFRTVAVRAKDGMYINDVKIKFKGVNRHSFWPASGRTTSKALSVADILLMKEMNMNAVRMSHYPPDRHFLDMCDSLGLYVMDELAGWHGKYDTPIGSKLLHEMMVHDENHPSIVFWANGNEGGHNLELDHLFAEQDLQGRPVIHPWNLFGGFDTQHYREYNYGIGNYDQGHHIVMPTEFLHGMYDGGHGAGLEDYWKAMWLNPLSAGGFLWDFADQGVLRTDKKDKNPVIDTDGNHGADGIVGPYHEKEGSFYAIKEIWSPIYPEHREITPEFDGVITLENRYAFTNLKDCSFSWKLEKLAFSGKTVVKRDSGKISSPDLLPLQKGNIKLFLPKNWKEYTVLYLTAKDPYQREIFTWSYPIVMASDVARQVVQKSGDAKISIKESETGYAIKIKDIELLFDRHSGLLQKISNQQGIIPLSEGPVLQEGENNFKNFNYRQQGDSLVISSAFDRKKAYNTLEWTIYSSGWVKMRVQYFPGAYFTNFAGVNFSFPEQQMKGVTYLGNGPYRVWKNRRKGNRFGIWNKPYNDVSTGESPNNYPEFKGYHDQMYWLKVKGREQGFTVVTDQQDLFFRLYTPKKQDDPYGNLQATFPDGDLSFMQAISGIGTKTQKPETTGPMGMKNIYYDYEKEPSRAKQLVLYFNFSGETPGESQSAHLLSSGNTKESLVKKETRDRSKAKVERSQIND